MTSEDIFQALHERAYAAMGRGALAEAAEAFAALLREEPEQRNYHYMKGLAHKYLRDWPASLRHNLRSIKLSGGKDNEAAHWNAAIAATAMGRWPDVRRLWKDCGLRMPKGDGPIEHDFGLAVVRLNPWGDGETVFARRIDPVRARLLNVPLAESGHRFGDIVLHDGASLGRRVHANGEAPVFNELTRLVASEFRTFAVFVSSPDSESLQPLLEATAPGIGYIEDWTQSVRTLCLRCSYGVVHTRPHQESEGWDPDRNLGIAAQSPPAVEKLLKDWARSGKKRRVEAIESRECDVPEPAEGQVWWRGPEEDDKD